MDQTNLDAMFDDMLGELDIISQQLEDSSGKTVSQGARGDNRALTCSPSSIAEPEHVPDVDLNAMLNDLTHWENNLTSAPEDHPEKSGGSQDSGIGFNDNSLNRDSSKLSVQYGMDGSPQFNTLKRSMTDGPSVTFGEEDLSLESLEKDLEQEKRNVDKSRQISAEELAALSPVMQELDDLVSDLSNLSFQQNFTFEDQAANEKKNLVPDISCSVLRPSTAPFQCNDMTEKEDVPCPAIVSQNVTRSLANDAQCETQNKKVPRSKKQIVPVPEENSTHLSEKHSHQTTCNTEKGAVLHQSPTHYNNDSKNYVSASPSPSQSLNLNAARRLENVTQSQHTHSANRRQLDHAHSLNQKNGFRGQPMLNCSKPPVSPPPTSKPKLPEKPLSIGIRQRQNSVPTPTVSPKPTTPVKRQPSVKVPANLSNILERQILQKNSMHEQTVGSLPTSAKPFTVPAVFNETETDAVTSKSSFMGQNSTEFKTVIDDNSLVRKHSTSLASVESNISSTSSAISVRSNSSTESTASDLSMQSADNTNERFIPADIKRLLAVVHMQDDVEQLTPEMREDRMKAVKMRIALEKLKEARIQKLVVKVFNKDDSSKTLVVDERMTTRSVIKQLLEKNHYELSINWALVEELPSLFMERIFEEHESVTEMLSYWTRDTTNQIRFLERKDKYALFRNPQHYLLSTSDAEGQMAERQKQTLIEEFFSGLSGTGVPEVQGVLYIKGESKSWSKKYCVLRTSGLYFSKSGEPKKGKKVSDLQCLVMFEQVCVYLGRGWKKKHKSQTDYGFALKHPAIQTKSKHIRYFCCEDVRSLMRWIVGIRCAKYGKQLKDNYDQTNAETKGSNDGPTMPYQTQQSDRTSNIPVDGNEVELNSKQVPRATLTNMFEGAWQRANEQESTDAGNEGGLHRAKSVWNPIQSKTNSNWWDLGAAPELEELAESTNAPIHASSLSETTSVNQRGSISSVQDTRTPTAYSNSSAPKLPVPKKVTQPPPPPMKISVPPSQRTAGTLQPLTSKGAPPPPPPAKPMPPRPPVKPVGISPPTPGPKPFMNKLPVAVKPLPLPPSDDLPPPPPPLDDMLPPPPMEDLPPPPPDDDIPLPPPMELNSNPGLPKGLRAVDGRAPVRLPFLPMFKNGNPLANLRPRAPNPRPGRSPHAMSNFNSSNNKPPLFPRDAKQQLPPDRLSPPKQATAYPKVSGNKTGQPTLRPPLTEYYNSNMTHDRSVMYSVNDFPPPPDFIFDLKETFHHVSHKNACRMGPSFDLPPPPPELLLSEVRCRSHQETSPISAKPAPPPPKRNPNTRLSFKRQ